MLTVECLKATPCRGPCLGLSVPADLNRPKPLPFLLTKDFHIWRANLELTFLFYDQIYPV